MPPIAPRTRFFGARSSITLVWWLKESQELEIGDRIDEQIAQAFEERNVSVGQAVKSLILTELGFGHQRLYLTAQFFENMPTDRRIGKEVRPEHPNDDVLGRVLDDL